MTTTEKLRVIEGILGAPDDAAKIQEAVEQALPSDVILNFRQIQAAIHSDRFPEPVENDKATRAFQSGYFIVQIIRITNPWNRAWFSQR
jgi:hypothetical protein